MLYSCLAIMVICGSVDGFTYQKGSSVTLGLREKSLLAQPILRATSGKEIALHPKVASMSIGSIGRSIATLNLDMKQSMDMFMRLTLKKKIVVVVCPLTIVFLYLFFTSTFATLQSRKLFRSFSSFMKSFRKKDASVSNLSASLAMKKSGDVATTTLIRKSTDVTRDDVEEKTSKLSSEASITRARREIELKLIAIAETEKRAKLKGGAQMNQSQQTLPAAQSIKTDVRVLAMPIQSDLISEIVAPVLALIAVKEEKKVVNEETILDISNSALLVGQQQKFIADATLATFFAIAVASPLFQPVLNFINQHVHMM